MKISAITRIPKLGEDWWKKFAVYEQMYMYIFMVIL